MLQHPQIDPVALQIGPLAIHWYGLTYLAAFALFFWLGRLRLRHQPYASITQPRPWLPRDVEDILFLGVVGVVAGGRLGYCLFYQPAYYLQHPLEVFYVWQGGMSFHGGLIGVMVAQLWYARSRGRPFMQVMDFVAPCVPTGLAAGRLGNFINGELWGRVSDVPWAVVFPQSAPPGTPLLLIEPRHPSQLYAAGLEGLVLLAWMQLRVWRGRVLQDSPGRLTGEFLVGYAVLRSLGEVFREPDAALILGLSRGTFYSLFVAAVGVVILRRARRGHPA